jgi:GNAT superfamily N-acetyltransferase
LRQFATSYPPDPGAFEASFSNLIQRTDAAFLVVEQESEIVGYLLGFYLPTLFANGELLEIVELIVDEPHRKKGLGRLLVETALELAWNRGCVEAVVPTRRARAFYESLGFSETAIYFKLKPPKKPAF